ncbi:MAG: hypothetical protein R2874_03975 [Desulfobacterales bacterium]
MIHSPNAAKARGLNRQNLFKRNSGGLHGAGRIDTVPGLKSRYFKPSLQPIHIRLYCPTAPVFLISFGFKIFSISLRKQSAMVRKLSTWRTFEKSSNTDFLIMMQWVVRKIGILSPDFQFNKSFFKHKKYVNRTYTDMELIINYFMNGFARFF